MTDLSCAVWQTRLSSAAALFPKLSRPCRRDAKGGTAATKNFEVRVDDAIAIGPESRRSHTSSLRNATRDECRSPLRPGKIRRHDLTGTVRNIIRTREVLK